MLDARWNPTRFDQLMNLAWKVMLPLGLVNLVGVAVWIEFGRPQFTGVAEWIVMAVFWFFDMLYLPIIGLAMVIISVLVIYGLASTPEQFE